MGYKLDRSNLLRYARSGRLVARKSQGAWLTTRAALQALIVELAAEARGRPRQSAPAWAEVEITPHLAASLAEIDALRAELARVRRSQAEREQLRRELIVEAIYHTNRIEGNPLSLSEVRRVVEAFWAEQGDEGPVLHENGSTYEPTPA
jgi:ribosomal protein L17